MRGQVKSLAEFAQNVTVNKLTLGEEKRGCGDGDGEHADGGSGAPRRTA